MAKQIHVGTILFNLVEFTMLYAVEWCWILFEGSLISIKHYPTFPMSSQVWTTICLATVFNIPCRWMCACPLSWICGYIYAWQWSIVYTVFSHCAYYPMSVQAVAWQANKVLNSSTGKHLFTLNWSCTICWGTNLMWVCFVRI